jgi:pilus assembly protein Flp/PilA
MLATIRHEIERLVRDEEGASLVEYVLLVALIAVVCIAAVTLLGQASSKKFTAVGDANKK